MQRQTDRHVERQEKTNRIKWRNTERQKIREPNGEGRRHIDSNRDKRGSRAKRNRKLE